MKLDLAKAENRNLWHRHPVLGDPSFDSFVRMGTVYQSQPPYEWAVNGSLFIDPKTGVYYCYAGLYPYGYALKEDAPLQFKIFKSDDQGIHWTSAGEGFESGFRFDGQPVASDYCPDVVMIYDSETDTYWLCYDWLNNGCSWESLFQPTVETDSGAALAWSKSPEGPFTRLREPFFSNYRYQGKLDLFLRGYASTLIKRQKDWIVFILCDSGPYFAWGLACMTAVTPHGPWSDPEILLSPRQHSYFPTPVEYFPCFVQGGKVYAYATSVALNRNYQAVYSSELEKAHLSSSWNLEQDGGVWHSRNIPQEQYGIWGQTIHGVIDNGIFTVVYPTKDQREFGTLSIAKRHWDKPFQEGFTLSGHAGKSISPTLASFGDFELDMEFQLAGNMELLFDYDGLLGPNHHGADASPHRQSLTNCYSLLINDRGEYRFIHRKDTLEKTFFTGIAREPIMSLKMRKKESSAVFHINGKYSHTTRIETNGPKPLALAVHEFSVLNCDKFEIEGIKKSYALRYNSLEAIQNAAQKISDWETDDTLDFQSEEHFVGTGPVYAKWNFIGDSFAIHAPKSPVLGSFTVLLDGQSLGVVSQKSDHSEKSALIFKYQTTPGRHCVEVTPFEGTMAIDIFTGGCAFI